MKDHLTHRLLLFQIGHCFHQGPNTAQMNAKVTSCHCLKRMAQLVLQVSLKIILNIFKKIQLDISTVFLFTFFEVVIILWSGSIANVSKIQYLVLTTSLFFATKGPAKEAAREKMIRNGNDPREYFEVPFKETGANSCVIFSHEVDQCENMVTRK